MINFQGAHCVKDVILTWANPATTDSVVAHFRRHGRACHQGNTFGLSDLQTSYPEPLVHAYLTYPTGAVVARFAGDTL